MDDYIARQLAMLERELVQLEKQEGNYRYYTNSSPMRQRALEMIGADIKAKKAEIAQLRASSR